MDRNNDVLIMVGGIEATVRSIQEARKLCQETHKTRIDCWGKRVEKLSKMMYISLGVSFLALFLHSIKADENDLLYQIIQKVFWFFI